MTKTTKNLDIEETQNEDVGKPNDVQETTEEVPTQIEKQKRTKKDRSPAQIQAFEKCLKSRREKAELQRIKKSETDKHKKEMEDEADDIIGEEIKQTIKKKKKKKPIVVKEESSSEDEPQVIYVKKRRKVKRKKKKVIYEDDSSSEEDDEEEKPKRKPKKIEKDAIVKEVDKETSLKNEPRTNVNPLNPVNCKAMNKLLLMRSMGF